MIGQQFILKKLSLGDIVSMSSVYMTWQLQKLLVVSWVGTGLRHSRLKVDPTILIVHRFQVFLNRKMCMQPCREGAYGGGAWGNGMVL